MFAVTEASFGSVEQLEIARLDPQAIVQIFDVAGVGVVAPRGPGRAGG